MLATNPREGDRGTSGEMLLCIRMGEMGAETELEVDGDLSLLDFRPLFVGRGCAGYSTLGERRWG